MTPGKQLKPWTNVLVRVADENTERGYRYFTGELVSFPTPERTIMVRTVPGMAATAIEVQIADIQLIRPKNIKVFLADVSGAGAFPSDMLRYDAAVPVNFTLDGQGKVVLEKGNEVAVVATATTGYISPFTSERWQSFGWNITNTRRYTPN